MKFKGINSGRVPPDPMNKRGEDKKTYTRKKRKQVKKMQCDGCKRFLREKKLEKCEVCEEGLFCSGCREECSNCERLYCSECLVDSCENEHCLQENACKECLTDCNLCGDTPEYCYNCLGSCDNNGCGESDGFCPNCFNICNECKGEFCSACVNDNNLCKKCR